MRKKMRKRRRRTSRRRSRRRRKKQQQRQKQQQKKQKKQQKKNLIKSNVLTLTLNCYIFTRNINEFHLRRNSFAFGDIVSGIIGCILKNPTLNMAASGEPSLMEEKEYL